MKLKKIASLALAGIMAVSMLAGCKDGNGNNGGASSSSEPTTTNVVTYANDVLSASEKEVFTFTSSTNLDTILKNVATDTSKFDSTGIERVFNSTIVVNAQVQRGSNTGYQEIKLLEGVEGKLDGIVTNNFANLPSSNVKTQKKVELYTISGAYEEKAAVQKIVEDFSRYIGDRGVFPESVKGKDCSYTAEISALKVASPEDAEKTAWVVAMVFTQTSTAKANAQT